MVYHVHFLNFNKTSSFSFAYYTTKWPNALHIFFSIYHVSSRDTGTENKIKLKS